jgi:hypothetical protein
VLIKIAIFPLANKFYAWMAKMKAVQPQIAALRERYLDDKAKQQQELMAHAARPCTMLALEAAASLSPGWEPLKRIDDSRVHRREMPVIARQNRQIVPPRGGGDDDVGKARRVTAAARPIGQGAGDLGRLAVKWQNAVAVEMQNGAQPR